MGRPLIGLTLCGEEHLAVRRRLFNFAAVASLLLCVATVSLWVRSYLWVEHFIHRSRFDPVAGKHIDSIGSARGALRYMHVRIEVKGEPADRMGSGLTVTRFSAAEAGGVAGGAILWGVPHSAFGCERDVELGPPGSAWRMRSTRISVGAPHGVLAALFAAVPVIAAVRWWRDHQRTMRGECRICGYDLRASPEYCPECGALGADRPQTAA